MSYSDVPLSTQRIFQTQPLIRTNFQMIKDGLQQDHVFDNNVPGQAEGTHKTVSLAGVAEPSSLPAGCDSVLFLGTDNALKLYPGPGLQSRNLSIYSISAAANFSGLGATGLIVPRSSFNCSINKTATGRYTITFTTPLLSNDYIVHLTTMRNGTDNQGWGGIVSSNTYTDSVTTTTLRIYTTDSGGNFADSLMVNLIVFGGQ